MSFYHTRKFEILLKGGVVIHNLQNTIEDLFITNTYNLQSQRVGTSSNMGLAYKNTVAFVLVAMLIFCIASTSVLGLLSMP